MQQQELRVARAHESCHEQVVEPIHRLCECEQVVLGLMRIAGTFQPGYLEMQLLGAPHCLIDGIKRRVQYKLM
jgi:hypothetical protein